MAKAHGVPPTIHVPVWEPYVTLTLSKEEAQALFDVTRSVGGSIITSRRRHFSDAPGSIMEALEPFVVRKDVKDKAGTIWFS